MKADLVAGGGGAVIWPLLIVVAEAKELLMTGDTIGAHEAKDRLDEQGGTSRPVDGNGDGLGQTSD